MTSLCFYSLRILLCLSQVLEEQVEVELEAERQAAEEEQARAKAAIDSKKEELQGLEAAHRQAVSSSPPLPFPFSFHRRIVSFLPFPSLRQRLARCAQHGSPAIAGCVFSVFSSHALPGCGCGAAGADAAGLPSDPGFRV